MLFKMQNISIAGCLNINDEGVLDLSGTRRVGKHETASRKLLNHLK